MLGSRAPAGHAIRGYNTRTVRVRYALCAVRQGAALVIRLVKRGRRIVITSDEPLPGLRTAVPGAYQSVSGAWTVPLSLESCILLRQKFGSRLDVHSELRRWVRGVQDARRAMSATAIRETVRLDTLPTAAPALYKAMQARPYQLVGVRFVADAYPGCLLADEPGLGKTLITLGGILESGVPGPYLVVAPKTASDATWRREIERWLPRSHRAVIMPQYRYQRNIRLRRTIFDDRTWVIIHPAMTLVKLYLRCHECGKRCVDGGRKMQTLKCGHRKTRRTKRYSVAPYSELFDVQWGVIVADEAHDSLILRSRSKITQRRLGMEMLPLRQDGKRIAVSGTPFDSKPHQLWGTLNWLDPVTYSAFYRWAELYWRKGGYTGWEIGELIREREPMLWDSLNAIALRRTKLEVARDLPPKVYVGTRLDSSDPTSPVGVWLDMHGEQLRAYEELETYSVAQLQSGRLDARTGLAELTRLKQLACSYGDITQEWRQGWLPDPQTGISRYQKYLADVYTPRTPSNKLEWILGSLEEWGYPRNPLTKVVIVSFYTGILECFGLAIDRHFRTRPGQQLCTAISGRVPPMDRRAIIDRFNNAAARPSIMLLNVKAGGTSITLDTADRMIFISETTIPDQQLQAEDRIHRVSNPRHCMYYYLRSNGTVDVGTALSNVDAAAASHRLLDGRRGIDYVRRIISLSKSRSVQG